MLIGSKPLSDMNEDEMKAAILELQGSREALRNEAIKQKKEREATGASEPRARRTPKADKVDPQDAAMLAFLKGEKDDI